MSSVESVRETTDILDQLVDACSIALTRFSEQNGEVEEHTWRKNYPAVKALGEALEGARGRPQVVSAPRRHGKVDEMKQSITLEELAHALFDVEMSEEDWDDNALWNWDRRRPCVARLRV